MRTRHGILALLILLAAAVPAAALEGEIAFLRGDQPASRQVCLVDLATGTVRPLGPGEYDGAPVFSPGGARVAFAAGAGAARRIHVVHVDSGETQVLETAHPWSDHPAWSPDGGALAYETGAGAEALPLIGVYTFPEPELTPGEETAKVTRETGEAIWAGSREGLLRPVYLPNLDLSRFLDPRHELQVPGVDIPRLWEEGSATGALLTMGIDLRDGAVRTEIYVVTSAQVMPLLLDMVIKESARFVEWGVAVDRKGQQVAFETNDGGDREVFVLGRRGAIDMSNHRAADWNPVWPRKGDWLAFESFRGGRRGVYVVYPKTALVRPVAASPDCDNWSPAWSPDAETIAYVSNASGVPRLMVVPFHGGEARALTEGATAEAAPAWRPRAGK